MVSQVFMVMVKEVKLMALSRGVRLNPVPVQLVYQSSITKRYTTQHRDHCQPNSVLGVGNQPGKTRTNTHSPAFFLGLQIPSTLSPCKTHYRQMAQTVGFDPVNNVKICFDRKIFDVNNWVACLKENWRYP